MKLPQKLRPKQEMARDYIYSDNFKNGLFVYPTGYGKTLSAMMAMDKVISEGRRVIYSSPMKALTSEQTETFGNEWGAGKVKEITGDTEDMRYTSEYLSEFSIFVFTPEKLFGMLKKESTRELFFDELEVDLVVFDEIHMLGDDTRGTNLEKLIMVLKGLYPFVHIVGLSATIGNVKDVARFIDAFVVEATRAERPVPLETEIKAMPTIYGGKKKFAFKMNIVQQFVDRHLGEKTIFFWSSRDRSINAVKQIAGIGEQRISGKVLVDKLVQHRVSYHNASLDATTRKTVENGFRGDTIDIISSTTTLAVGVNTPARNVIIGDCTRYNWRLSDDELLKPSEFHQMVGRAGRPGFDTIGRGFVICEEQWVDQVQAILDGSMEVTSKMGKNLDSHVLDFVTSFVDTKEGVFNILETGMSPPARQIVESTVGWLIEKKFIADDNGVLRPTFLGRMTSYCFILPETALHVVGVDKGIDPEMSKEPEFVALLDKLLDVEEFLENIVVRKNFNDDLAMKIAAKVFKFSDERIAKAFSFIFFKFLEKKGILDDEEKKMGYGEEDKPLREAAGRIIGAAAMICTKHKRIYSMLGDMVDSGFINVKLMELYNLHGIGQVRLDKLVKAGIDSLKAFLGKTDAELAVIMGITVDHVKEMKMEASQAMAKAAPSAKPAKNAETLNEIDNRTDAEKFDDIVKEIADVTDGDVKPNVAKLAVLYHRLLAEKDRLAGKKAVVASR